MISVTHAQQIILRQAKAWGNELCSLTEAVGRVLQTAISLLLISPPWTV